MPRWILQRNDLELHGWGGFHDDDDDLSDSKLSFYRFPVWGPQLLLGLGVNGDPDAHPGWWLRPMRFETLICCEHFSDCQSESCSSTLDIRSGSLGVESDGFLVD